MQADELIVVLLLLFKAEDWSDQGVVCLGVNQDFIEIVHSLALLISKRLQAIFIYVPVCFVNHI